MNVNKVILNVDISINDTENQYLLSIIQSYISVCQSDPLFVPTDQFLFANAIVAELIKYIVVR